MFRQLSRQNSSLHSIRHPLCRNVNREIGEGTGAMQGEVHDINDEFREYIGCLFGVNRPAR